MLKGPSGVDINKEGADGFFKRHNTEKWKWICTTSLQGHGRQRRFSSSTLSRRVESPHSRVNSLLQPCRTIWPRTQMVTSRDLHQDVRMDLSLGPGRPVTANDRDSVRHP